MPRLERRFNGDALDVIRVTPTSVVVGWEFSPTVEDLTTVTVAVYRSYDKAGADEVLLATVPGAPSYYVDGTARLLDRAKHAYYRLHVEGGSTPPFNTQWRTVGAEPSPAAAAILRRNTLLFQKAGVPVWIFKRRRQGERCPDCWDATLQSVFKTNCATCLGTGFTQGYYDPIATMVNILPSSDRNQLEDLQRQPRTTSAITSAYPDLAPGDVLVEMETADRWRISTPLNPIEMHRVVIAQELVLEGVNLADEEYSALALPSTPGPFVIEPPPYRKIRLASWTPRDDAVPPVGGFNPRG